MDRKSSLTASAILAVASLVLPGCGFVGHANRAVDPGLSKILASPGGRYDRPIHVRPPPGEANYEPMDIAIVFDGTSSMGALIGSFQRSAHDILNDLSAKNPDLRVAVVEFGDYAQPACRGADGLPVDHDKPVWRLVQNFTSDLPTVQAAVNQVGVHWNGCDTPESYLRAVDEVRQLNWRAGSRYIAVLGDAPFHDPDPGRDGILGTDDDLTLAGVTRQLALAKISLIGVYSLHGGDAATAAAFRALSDQTPGGIAVPLKDAGEVRSALKKGLVERAPTPPVLKLSDKAFSSWIRLGERVSAGRRMAAMYTFPVTVSPPKGAASGVYNIPFTAFTDVGPNAHILGPAVIQVRMGWQYFPWKIPMAILVALLSLLILGAAIAREQRYGVWGLEFSGEAAAAFLRVALAALIALGLSAGIWFTLPEDPHSSWLETKKLVSMMEGRFWMGKKS